MPVGTRRARKLLSLRTRMVLTRERCGAGMVSVKDCSGCLSDALKGYLQLFSDAPYLGGILGLLSQVDVR